MAIQTMTFAAELTVIHCGVCGGVYAISERYRLKKQQEGGGWHCPYCDADWGFFGSSEVDKLKKKLEDAARREQWAKDNAEWERKEKQRAQHSLRAAKGHQTRLKKRIAAGVCPCCNRSFENLARHMAGQHPEFTAEPTT